MMDNMRVANEQATILYEELLKALAENKKGKDFERKLSEMWNLRDRAQRYARDVAPYFHPQLQAIKHDHRTADGAPLRPILVIEGYPSEPPVPAIEPPKPEPTPVIVRGTDACTHRPVTVRRSRVPRP
jgi:hypothetical protein